MPNKRTYKISSLSDSDYKNLLMNRISEYSVPGNIDRELAWRELERAFYPSSRYLILKIAVAASFLLLLGTGLWLNFQFSDNVTISGPGEISYTRLPDGTSVYVNSASTVSFRRYGWKKDRKVFLDGEAFFDVTPGTGFSVISGSIEIRVLGTSFNVYDRSDEFIVSCITGQVEIITAAGEQLVLNAGENIRGTGEYTEDINNFNMQAGSWIRGEFHYNSESLEKVFREMERQFNIEITYNPTRSRSYTGYFNNSDLLAALEYVCLPMQLNYRFVSDNQIIIY